MLPDELINGVGHSDDNKPRLHGVIGEGLDSVCHQRECFIILYSIEFIEDKQARLGVSKKPPHNVGVSLSQCPVFRRINTHLIEDPRPNGLI